MVDVIVSNNCPHCTDQKVIMQDAFYHDEYRIIHIDSTEFQKYTDKEIVDAVPFIIVRDEDGNIKHANKGQLEAIKIRRIMNSEGNTFNLKTTRATC
jgi:glutaredoxin